MAKEFDNECPYCGSRAIKYWGHVDDFGVASDAEEYHCSGKCQKTFYKQNCDERMVMKPTMKREYLAWDSSAITLRGNLDKKLDELGIETNASVCGNCVSFSFNYEKLACSGSCSFQDEKIVNFAISDKIEKGALDAKTDASECNYFFNFRTDLRA